MFEQIKDLAIAEFDDLVGLDTSNVALDASMQKAPYGGEATGPNLATEPSWDGSGR